MKTASASIGASASFPCRSDVLLGVAAGGAVVDAAPGQLGDPPGGEPPVRRAGRDHDAVRCDRRPIGELDDELLAWQRLDSHYLRWPYDLRAAAPRLNDGSAAELGSGQAGVEAEVVLDSGALAGLPARRLALEQDSGQSLGRAVDGRREAGGAAPDDRELVVIEGRFRGQAPLAGELQGGGIADRNPL